LLEPYRDMDTGDLLAALEGLQESAEVEADEEAMDFGQFVPKAGAEEE